MWKKAQTETISLSHNKVMTIVQQQHYINLLVAQFQQECAYWCAVEKSLRQYKRKQGVKTITRKKVYHYNGNDYHYL